MPTALLLPTEGDFVRLVGLFFPAKIFFKFSTLQATRGRLLMSDILGMASLAGSGYAYWYGCIMA